MIIDRRTLIRGGLAAGALAGLARTALSPGNAAAGPTAAERGQLAEIAATFVRTHEVPGLGVAFAHDGQLLYEDAAGLADRDAGTRLTTDHCFRVASISKPITAVAVFRLIEEGGLALDDRVFGPAGILGEAYGPVPDGSPIGDITVDHLLTHTAGGWPNRGGDPMFRDTDLDHAALIRETLRSRALATAPGSAFAYSNFGYCVLGRIVEKRTGRAYADHVRAAILEPVGATGMAIAGNTLAERQLLEVRYHGHGRDDPYAHNVRRMDAHGGWLARPAALARFAASLGASAPPTLLKPDSIAAMVRPSPVNPQYARGWRLSGGGNWWHAGQLPGTTGFLVRTRRGLCWALLINTRRREDGLARELDRLGWALAKSVPDWRA